MHQEVFELCFWLLNCCSELKWIFKKEENKYCPRVTNSSTDFSFSFFPPCKFYHFSLWKMVKLGITSDLNKLWLNKAESKSDRNHEQVKTSDIRSKVTTHNQKQPGWQETWALTEPTGQIPCSLASNALNNSRKYSPFTFTPPIR